MGRERPLAQLLLLLLLLFQKESVCDGSIDIQFLLQMVLSFLAAAAATTAAIPFPPPVLIDRNVSTSQMRVCVCVCVCVYRLNVAAAGRIGSEKFWS